MKGEDMPEPDDNEKHPLRSLIALIFFIVGGIAAITGMAGGPLSGVLGLAAGIALRFVE